MAFRYPALPGPGGAGAALPLYSRGSFHRRRRTQRAASPVPGVLVQIYPSYGSDEKMRTCPPCPCCGARGFGGWVRAVLALAVRVVEFELLFELVFALDCMLVMEFMSSVSVNVVFVFAVDAAFVLLLVRLFVLLAVVVLAAVVRVAIVASGVGSGVGLGKERRRVGAEAAQVSSLWWGEVGKESKCEVGGFSGRYPGRYRRCAARSGLPQHHCFYSWTNLVCTT